MATPETRKTFIRSALLFLRLHEFDGIDIDWQYPGNNGSPPDDKQRFTTLVKVRRLEYQYDALSFPLIKQMTLGTWLTMFLLCENSQELRDAIEKEAVDTKKTPLLLSCKVSSIKSTVDKAYEVAEISGYVW